MSVKNIEDLKSAVLANENEFEVIGVAFDFCDEIRRSQLSASGNDWSIVASGGWMGIFTNFNHKIHRFFMSEEKKNREDLAHNISKNYIIRKTDQNNKYRLLLRK